MFKTLIDTDLHSLIQLYLIRVNLRNPRLEIREYNSPFFCKTKPIYSLCVLRDAYCEWNLKKQSQSIRYAYCVPSTSLRTRMRIAKGT